MITSNQSEILSPARSRFLRWHLRYVFLRLHSSLQMEPATRLLRRRSPPPALRTIERAAEGGVLGQVNPFARKKWVNKRSTRSRAS
jgi:hypothetical protein